MLVDTLRQGSVTQQWNLRRRQLINMIGANGDTFCTLVLTLHKTVLYASNRGRYRPNETIIETCLGGVFAFLRLPMGGLFVSPRSERTHGDDVLTARMD
jgi:hypothetical protein